MSNAPNDSKARAETELHVPMRDVVGFVRQLSHDLRNHLNAAELQSAYLTELAENPDLKTELQRLRGMLTEMGGSLHRLTSSLASIKLTLMPYEADGFMQDLGQKLALQFPEECRAIDWEVRTGNTLLNVDPQILQQAFLELFANAFQHGRSSARLTATAELKDGEFVFILREPKEGFAASTGNWGREPFGQVSHGHYGLGLPRARHIIEAHGGRLQVHYDQPSSLLVTTVVLPMAGAE
jgi:K+-sensing histidine kinase KdpD